MAVNKVAFTFNPFTRFKIKVDPRKKRTAQKEIADFVKESVLDFIGERTSPVKGGTWKSTLKKKYAQLKAKQVGSSLPDLELSGAMLDALAVKRVNSERLSLQIVGRQAGKADGNNRGTYGKRGSGLFPRRREFIPVKGKDLEKKIWDGIEDILQEFEVEENGES